MCSSTPAWASWKLRKRILPLQVLFACKQLPSDWHVSQVAWHRTGDPQWIVFVIILVPEQLEHFSHFCLGMSRTMDLWHHAEDTNKQTTVATCGCWFWGCHRTPKILFVVNRILAHASRFRNVPDWGLAPGREFLVLSHHGRRKEGQSRTSKCVSLCCSENFLREAN